MFSAVLALALSARQSAPPATTPASDATPVKLERKLNVGDRLTYSVKADYTSEERSGMTLTFVPIDQSVAYNFTVDVLKGKADGIVDAMYRRPKMTFTVGDTVERGPVSKTENLDWRIRMTLSPINEILDVKDETPKKKKAAVLRVRRQAEGVVLAVIGQFVQEIQQLSFFVGSFDSSLDLAPRLPFEAVKPGDTWQRTVGYSPQKLKGQGSKQAVQRLDYTYKYVGLITSNGRKVNRVTATLNLKTDLAEFGKQLGASLGDSFITKAPTTLDATIDYDLDPKTGQTIRAEANSSNSFSIFLKGFETPIEEARAKGTTTLTLVSRTKAPASATAAPKGTKKRPGSE